MNKNRALIALPLVLVNAAAIFGQSSFFYEYVTNATLDTYVRVILAVLLAVSLESIGVYLAYEAHTALLAGDASGKLRIASYAVALVVASLNYAHFTAGSLTHPTATAVTFALLSAVSPWLWGIRSRSLNRDRLRSLSLIDERGPYFSTTRKILFPVKTFKAFRHGVWYSITNPRDALASWERSCEDANVNVATSGDAHEFPTTLPTTDTAGHAVVVGDAPQPGSDAPAPVLWEPPARLPRRPGPTTLPTMQEAPQDTQETPQETPQDIEPPFLLPAGVSKKEAYTLAHKHAKGDRARAFGLLSQHGITIDPGYAHNIARRLDKSA